MKGDLCAVQNISIFPGACDAYLLACYNNEYGVFVQPRAIINYGGCRWGCISYHSSKVRKASWPANQLNSFVIIRPGVFLVFFAEMAGSLMIVSLKRNSSHRLPRTNLARLISGHFFIGKELIFRYYGLEYSSIDYSKIQKRKEGDFMLEMTLEEVLRLQERQDGKHSEMYLQIKDRLAGYDDMEIPFKEEFLFFENKYLLAIEHLIRNNPDIKKVVDIGCEMGFQSEWLKGMDYVGIDCLSNRFFNEGSPGVQYLVGTFPSIDVDLSDAAVISSMSLGYFPGVVHQDEDEATRLVVEALSKSNHLYVATTEKLREALMTVYDSCEFMQDKEGFTMYYFTRKKGSEK